MPVRQPITGTSARLAGANSGARAGSSNSRRISAEIAAHNARTLGHTAAEEIKILALHGILHLRGYNHERDRGQMARREEKLRRDLRLPIALIERGRRPRRRT